ncbi:MAG TPA: EF-hand domain-containing protein [Pirellulales bacterium]|nr:EF-hand domain-containing protein [Pirellulales bacterium]
MSCQHLSFMAALLLLAPLSILQAEEKADPKADRSGLFKQVDANGDGQISEAEVPEDKRRLFGRLVSRGDANGDGQLSLEEFTKAMADDERTAPPAQPGGEQFRQFLESDPQEVFKRLDANGDGKIELSELPEQMRGRMERFFDDFDANRDKSLTLDEFKTGQERLRAMIGLPQPSRQAMPGGLLRVLDTNGDGTLSKEEIAAAPESLRKLDQDGDGSLNGRELMAVLPPQPGQPGNPATAQRKPDGNRRPEAGAFLERLRGMDQNGDGKWSEDELPPFLRQQFGKLDANGDKFVDADELKQGLPRLRRPQD